MVPLCRRATISPAAQLVHGRQRSARFSRRRRSPREQCDGDPQLGGCRKGVPLLRRAIRVCAHGSWLRPTPRTVSLLGFVPLLRRLAPAGATTDTFVPCGERLQVLQCPCEAQSSPRPSAFEWRAHTAPFTRLSLAFRVEPRRTCGQTRGNPSKDVCSARSSEPLARPVWPKLKVWRRLHRGAPMAMNLRNRRTRQHYDQQHNRGKRRGSEARRDDRTPNVVRSARVRAPDPTVGCTVASSLAVPYTCVPHKPTAVRYTDFVYGFKHLNMLVVVPCPHRRAVSFM
jgi:hypothetical protein